MAPRTRGKAAKAARRNKQPTQLGKLDVTPTSRHLQSPQAQRAPELQEAQSSNPKAPVSQPRPNSQVDEFDDGVDDGDLIELEYSQQVDMKSNQEQNFAWSDAGSLTRRSSPLREGHTTGDGWQFGESDAINPLSSPRSGLDKLPDTVPLPSGPPPDPKLLKSPAVPKAHFDLSETASTMLRSSPYTTGSVSAEGWQFNESASQGGQGLLADDEGSRPEPSLPESPPAHYPIDELYEATPPRSRLPKTDAKQILANVKRGQSHIFRDPKLPRAEQEEGQLNTEGSKGQKKAMKDLLIAELGSDDDKPSTNPDETQRQRKTSPTAFHGERRPAGKDKALKVTHVSPPAPPESVSIKKRRQWAKPPIQFDDATNQIKEIPRKRPHFTSDTALTSATKSTVQPSKAATANTKKRSAPNATTKKEPLAKRQKAAPKPKGKLLQPLAYKNANPVAVGASKGKPAKPTTKKPKKEPPAKKSNDKQEVPLLLDTARLETEHISISSDHDSEISSDNRDSPKLPCSDQSSVASRNAPNLPAKDDLGPPAEPPRTGNKPSLAQGRITGQEDNESSTRPPLNPVEKAKESAKSSGVLKAGESSKRVTRSMMRNVSNETEKARILTPRDPNKATRQTTRPPRQKTTGNPRTLGRPEAPSRPVTRKSAKASRSFSVSEVGSPVPAVSDQGRSLKGHPHNWDKGSSPQFLGD